MPNTRFELIYTIVRFGVGSKIIKFAKQHGINGCTVFLGKGTVKSPILEFLELNEVRREIVLMAADSATAQTVLEGLNAKFEFEKPYHGIAFTISVTDIVNTDVARPKHSEECRGESSSMYNLIFTVVERGKAEFVIEAANKAGSRGATVINGRGSGIHETNKLFAMEIEPEKEIVMIIAQSALTEAIVNSIRDHLHVDEPGNGIIFVQEVNMTFGLR